MQKLAAFLVCGLLGSPAYADMYQDASNSKTSEAFRFGSGLTSLTYAKAVTTTASTVNGSFDITVANPAGITVDDTLYDMSPSFVTPGGIDAPGGMTVVVKAIAGNVLTLSNKANLTTSGASVTFGLNRMHPGNTLMTGQLVAHQGLFGNADGKSTWVNQYWGGVDYPNMATVFSVSDAGVLPGLFALRTSDGTPSSVWRIGLGTLVVDDHTSVAHSTWNRYDQSVLIGSGAGVGQHIQTESSVFSRWDPQTYDPYVHNKIGGSENLRLDCGYEAGTSRNCTTALHILNNQAKYQSSAIIVGDDAVEPGPDGLSSALQLAKNYSIDWFYPNASPPWPAGTNSTKAWSITSDNTPAGGTSKITLGEYGVVTHTSSTESPQTKYVTNVGPGAGHAMTVGMESAFNAVIDLTAGTPLYVKIGGTVYLLVGNNLTQVTTNLAVPSMTTSCAAAGGVSGTLWNDAGTVKICP